MIPPLVERAEAFIAAIEHLIANPARPAD